MLVEAKIKDAKYFYDLYMHPQINPYILYEMMDFGDFFPIFEDLIAKKILYIFENEGKSIGMVKLIPQTYRCAHVIYLGGLAIDPQYVGLGLGEKLVKESIAFVKKLGFERIELSVSTENKNAIRLYEKLGFEREGTLKKFAFLKSENRYLDEHFYAYLVD